LALADEKGVKRLALAQNGAFYATDSADAIVKLYDINSGNLVREFKGLAKSVLGLAFRPDNQQLAGVAEDKTLLLWNINDANVQLKFTLPVAGGPLAYSADSKKLVVACADDVLRTFNPVPQQPQQGVPPAPLAATQELRGGAGQTRSLAFVPNDPYRAVGVSGDGQLRLWPIAAPEPVFSLGGHQSFIYNLAYSPDGRQLASASNDKTIKLWDALAGKELRTIPAQGGPVYSVAYNPQGNLLASGGYDKTIRIFDPNNGLELRQCAGAEAAVYSVAFHPNGSLLAAAGLDRKIRLYDANSGSAGAVLTGHKDDIYRVQFNPAGTRLMSIGYSGEIHIWDVGNPAKPLHSIKLPVVLYTGSYFPDGKKLAVAASNGITYLVDLPPQAQ
jgi:WD40 repeat protein